MGKFKLRRSYQTAISCRDIGRTRISIEARSDTRRSDEVKLGDT